MGLGSESKIQRERERDESWEGAGSDPRLKPSPPKIKFPY